MIIALQREYKVSLPSFTCHENNHIDPTCEYRMRREVRVSRYHLVTGSSWKHLIITHTLSSGSFIKVTTSYLQSCFSLLSPFHTFIHLFVSLRSNCSNFNINPSPKIIAINYFASRVRQFRLKQPAIEVCNCSRV
jgi:hypothetical protein